MLGYGLRQQHFSAWLQVDPPPWLEVMVDDIIGHRGGPGLAAVGRLAEGVPLVFHGIGLNIGGYVPLDESYLRGLKELANRFQPLVLSDHLCFTRTENTATFELLPFPLHWRYLTHIAERVQQVQDYLDRQISLENISRYIDYPQSEMEEGSFFSELTQITGCGLLLDVNNIYVNAVNFGQNVDYELSLYPLKAVTQIHVAGHSVYPTYLFDTHDQPVADPVLRILEKVMVELRETTPVILEWDDPAADLATVLGEGARICQAFVKSSGFCDKRYQSHAEC